MVKHSVTKTKIISNYIIICQTKTRDQQLGKKFRNQQEETSINFFFLKKKRHDSSTGWMDHQQANEHKLP